MRRLSCRLQTALEEVLVAALRDSRRTLVQLEEMQKVVEQQLERERKQFDRLHFSFQKAQGDAAYIRTLQKMMDEGNKASS